jgi:glycosyltransferase involved in cell wall biosynthesis
MKILVALPVAHRAFDRIGEVLAGEVPCSGTDGAIIRLADLLHRAGMTVCLSAASGIASDRLTCITHGQVRVEDFDRLIVHQSHWNGHTLSFGDQALPNTILWAHVTDPDAFLYTFLDAGGRQVVFPSVYHANLYRAMPQWRRKFVVIPNSYAGVFQPVAQSSPQPRLIFIGAISRHKGFPQLTQVWSYLAKQNADLQLVIAGSRAIHYLGDSPLGGMGIAELELEKTCIQPWIESLPDRHKPIFLGALSPFQLQQEITQSWAAIVNPDWQQPETFCVAAVDAQACGRTVFSVAQGGLKETVYRGGFDSLVSQPSVAALGDRILAGLQQKERVMENGRRAAEFVRQKFSPGGIAKAWIDLLVEQGHPPLPTDWGSLRDVTHDLMRWSGTGMLVKQRFGGNKPENSRVLAAYQRQKQLER